MQNNKTFRLFISSTFNDFREERKALQKEVFPEIKKHCSKNGLTFQPIDLRWGVTEEAQLDQKALELCLNEVRSCKLHPAPNFLLMLGDRYGWIPLPYHIKQSEFESISNIVKSENEKVQIIYKKDTDKPEDSIDTREYIENREVSKIELLEQWYLLDENQIPASYVLQVRNPETLYIHQYNWQPEENELRQILHVAVGKLKIAQKSEKGKKYFQSATEAEIIEGVLSYLGPTEFQKTLIKGQSDLVEIDKRNIFGFFRSIDEERKVGDDFISGGKEGQKNQDFKGRVKAELSKTLELKTHRITEETLDPLYLEKFKTDVEAFLIDRVNEQLNEIKAVSELDQEIQAHQDYAGQKVQSFIGQEAILQQINDYCQNVSHQPLVIYGPSGRGKSAIMAKAFEEQADGIIRFVGATPNASAIKPILYSIFEQLGIDARTPQEIENEKLNQDGTEKSLALDPKDNESFEDFSFRMHDQIMQLKTKTKDKNITIFIDAVDQLTHSDQFLWLPNTLPSNVKIVISALDDASYPEDSKYHQILKNKTDQIFEVEAFNETDGLELLQNLLQQQERKLQPHQETYFKKQFQSSPTPLYITLAAQEVAHWKSYDRVADSTILGQPETTEGEEQDLRESQQGIIAEFIQNLSDFYHHDPKLVNRVLGYLLASKDGLSESEILQLIAQDSGFIDDIATDLFHKKETSELPMAVWARLQMMLKPFLSQKEQDGETLLYFFHREFEDVVKKNPAQKAEHEAIILATQELITANQDKPFESNRWGKIYIILVTEYDITYSDDKHKTLNAVFIANPFFKEWVSGFCKYLMGIAMVDFRHSRIKLALSQFKLLEQVTRILKRKNKYWIPFYITSIGNLALVYKSIDERERAISLSKEALRISKALYQKKPDYWISYYITSLNNSVAILNDLNKPKQKYDYDAISLAETAFNLVRKLYLNDPVRWKKSYIFTLNNLASSHLMLKEFNSAIEYARFAVDITEELYLTNPMLWIDSYSISINNLSDGYIGVGDPLKARTIQEKGLSDAKYFYNRTPELWAELYTIWLTNLAKTYKGLSELQLAIELEEEALEIIESLYNKSSQRWAKVYIGLLENLTDSYEKLCEPQQDDLFSFSSAFLYGKSKGAEELVLLKYKILRVIENLYQSNPKRWFKDYSSILKDLVDFFYELDKSDILIQILTESLAYTGKIYQINNNLPERTFFPPVDVLISHYKKIGTSKEAMELLNKSLDYSEAFYKLNPKRCGSYYLKVIKILIYTYRDSVRLNEIEDLLDKALDISGYLYLQDPNHWTEFYKNKLIRLAMSEFISKIIGNKKFKKLIVSTNSYPDDVLIS